MGHALVMWQAFMCRHHVSIIFVLHHVLIMWNLCIPVLFCHMTAGSLYEVYIYWHCCLICAHEVIGMCGIFVTGTYLVIMCDMAVEIGCTLVDMGKYVGSIWPFTIMAESLIFAMWQPYLCCNVGRGMIWNTIERIHKKSYTLIVLVFWGQSINDLIWSL